MNLWKLSEGWKGEPVLWLTEPDNAERARTIALHVPGAVIDAGGGVTGPMHALFACLEVAGQPQDWSKLGVEKPNALLLRPEWRRLPDFQQKGAAFMFDRLQQGILNNDDMGLGKTVQTIAALGPINDHVKVVLCQAMLRPQWKEEIERWCDLIGGYNKQVHVIYPKADRRSLIPPHPETRWIVAYYLDHERALTVADQLRKPYFLIVDEIHNVQGWGTKRASSVGTLSAFAAGRVGLTGSQLYNNVAKMYGILSLINPGQWGSFGEYATRYASGSPGAYGGWETGALSNAAELRNRMGAVSFRRTLHDVYDQLPFEAKFQTVWLDIGADAGSVQAAMVGGMAGRTSHLRAVNAAKVPVLVEQLKSDMLAGTPSLTFTWMKEHAREIAKQAPGALCLTGDDNNRLEKISAYLARCKAGKNTPTLVCTWDSLGTGVNLQWAKVTNLAALSYTPDDLRQALHRMVRMGNEGELLVRIFVAKNTLDEHYIKVLKEKLGEQFKLAGRREKEKADFEAAFSERTVKDSLRAMYERALREEKIR